jgi:hypothetical protein
MATTSIGAPGVTFPDATVMASATTGNVVVRTYTSPSPWTKPTGLKQIRVTVTGAGGNGASGTNNNNGGGGGGGGGTAIGVYPAPAIASSLTVTVGTAGNPASFGATISATSGVNGGTGGGANGGAGGVGSNGQINMYGTNGIPGGGAGGISNLFLGQPGSAGTPTTSPGGNATGYGAGGGGGAQSTAPFKTGGTGASGYIVVEEYY